MDAARAILERKAQVYEKLSKGKSGGLTDKQVDTLLVDVRPHKLPELHPFSFAPQFDSKVDHYESDSDDVDESLTVPGPPINDVCHLLSLAFTKTDLHHFRMTQ